MRHGSGGRRSRNRGKSKGRGKRNKQTVYDSNGPDVRVRGTAHQVRDKYVALAKDATSSGDNVLSISYLQHAEHYERLINDWEDTRQDMLEDMKKAEENPAGEDNDMMVGKKHSSSSRSRVGSSHKRKKQLENA